MPQGRITVDTSGAVRAVEHSSNPITGYLTMGLPQSVDLSLAPSATAIDADEIESVLTDGAGVGITLRHTFVAGWQFRCVIVNVGTESRRLRVSLPISVDPATTGWAVAEGAEAELFVLPRDGRGPVLSGRLRQGSVERIDEEGLHLPELVLEPAGRYVLAWEWDWLEVPSSHARKRPGAHPVLAVRTVGEAIRVPAGPDIALITPPDVGAEQDEDGYEFTQWETGTFPIELRSARGLRTIDLTWTSTLEDLLAEAAEGLVAGPRGATGVPVLPSPDAAVVLQHAVAAELVDDLDDANDMLDLYTARLDLESAQPVVGALYLCGEHGRTGDVELLNAASRSIIATPLPTPGLGLVATRICVARLVAGLSPQPVMEHLLEIARRVLRWPLDQLGERSVGLSVGGDRTSGDEGLTAAVAELLAVTRSVSSSTVVPVRAGVGVEAAEVGVEAAGVGVEAADDDVLTRLVLALGTDLGGGLPGRRIEPLPDDRLGQLLATLSVVPDDLSASTRRAWGQSARELAEQATPRLLARLDRRTRPGRERVDAAYVWLVLLAGAG